MKIFPIDEAIKLYTQDKLSTREIGRIIGFSSTTVLKYLKDAEVWVNFPKYDDEGNRRCSKCEVYKPESHFPLVRGGAGLRECCRLCFNAGKAASARLHPENAEAKRNRRLVRVYNITAEQYNAMLNSQGGKCKICRTPAADYYKSFNIDHDHRCCPGVGSCGNCIRGLLCNNCNKGLGNFQDDTELLRKALNYLSE